MQVTIIIFGLLNTSKPAEGQSKLYASLHNSWGMQAALPEDAQVARYQLQVDRLLQLMQQRLMIAHDVALWKWNQRRSIEDSQREQELLAQLRQQATAYNLEPDQVSAFFQAQIEAGKLIQTTDFQKWQREGVKSFDNVPSLNQTLRPLVDQLGTELLSVLAELTPVLACPTLQELIESRAQIILRGNGIDQTVRRIVLAPLLEVKDTSCQGVSRLDEVNSTVLSPRPNNTLINTGV